MTGPERPFLYLLSVSVVVLVVIGHVFYLNYLYDPWWYFDGNKAGGDKYTFNDREAKINKFHSEKENFDCVILGSSRALTFNEFRIRKHKCFNFSLSSAKLPMMISYAEYFSRYVPNPKLVIVAIGERMFLEEEKVCDKDIGYYLQPTVQKPKHWYKTYFSIDALRFSKRQADEHRAVIGRNPRWRPVVHESRMNTSYQFAKRWGSTQLEFQNIADGQVTEKRYSSKCVKLNEGFRHLFPNARVIAYIPPITPDLVVHWYAQGNLTRILHAYYESSQYYDHYLDFSVPSVFTLNPELTWDGTHYKPAATRQIVRELVYNKPGIALDVKSLSFDKYETIYLNRIADLVHANLPDYLDQRLATYASDTATWMSQDLNLTELKVASHVSENNFEIHTEPK